MLNIGADNRSTPILDPSTSPHTLHHWAHHTGTWFLIPLLCWWRTALSFISTRWSNSSCTDLRLPGGYLGMDERTPSTAQPGKDWASCLPCNSNSTTWFYHPARFFYNYPIKLSHKSWCNLRWPAHFQRAHCKNCSVLPVCIAQHQKDQAFPYTAQLLVQALVISRLDYCNTLLAGLPSCTIKPLQMIQNAAARLVFSEHKRAHVTPFFIYLHWLLVVACIKFKTLMLAYRTTTGSARSNFHSLMTIYILSRSLRSAGEHHLMVTSQRGTKSFSRTFSFTVPGWWNDPPPIRIAESLTIFKWHLKTHLFRLHFTSAPFS